MTSEVAVKIGIIATVIIVVFEEELICLHTSISLENIEQDVFYCTNFCKKAKT